MLERCNFTPGAVRSTVADGFADEQADEAGVALLGQELQDDVQEFRFGVLGHVVDLLDVFADTPTGNHCGPPSTSFPRAGRHHPSVVRRSEGERSRTPEG